MDLFEKFPHLNFFGNIIASACQNFIRTCAHEDRCRTSTFNGTGTEQSYLAKLKSLIPGISSGPRVNFLMTTTSIAPRSFLVENFLSDFEADELIRLALPNVKASVVGQSDSGGIFASTTRTSSNTWIKRNTTPVVETLYRRVADLLGIQHQILTTHDNAEDIQVVHYHVGEEYRAHYDWGVRGYPESRFITVLLYLSDDFTGGETSFPKAKFKIHPKKGNAVVFYSLLEDGNGDINSLHASIPVSTGEKWLANFWVWDPYLPPAIRAKK